ncbi:MAG: ATP-binding protein [Bacteroidia bacterium]
MKVITGIISVFTAITLYRLIPSALSIPDMNAFREAKSLSEQADIAFSQIEGYVIILLDTSGFIRTWNKGAEKIKGYTSAEVVGKHIRIFYTQEDQDNGLPERLIQKALMHGIAHDEGARQKKDGGIVWVSTTLTAIRNENGEIIGLSKVTHDLTDRHREEQMRERHASDLETKNKEMSQITYVASHDLQSPLKTITNYTNLLYDEYHDKLGDDANMYLNVIRNATDRMKSLIKDLLDFSRIGQDRQQIIVDGNEIIRNVLADLAFSISESNATFDLSPMPIFNGYKTELALLFQNLIANALKFRKEGTAPHIKISAQKVSSDYLFTIQDNGIGIEEKYLSKIFEIFQRLNARSKYEGTGIGLAHCAKIVDLHGGKIWVESIPGEGSTFYFTIPDYHIYESNTELRPAD